MLFGRLFCRDESLRSFSSKDAGGVLLSMCQSALRAVSRTEEVIMWVDISEVLRDGVSYLA